MIKVLMKNINYREVAIDFLAAINKSKSLFETTYLFYQKYLMERLLNTKEHMNTQIIEQELKKMA